MTGRSHIPPVPRVQVKREHGLLFLLFFALVVGCRPQDAVTEIAKSHAEANVPKGKLFDEYMRRDLTNYFCEGADSCNVEYELLRAGPTQTGIGYPKYYLWTKCLTRNTASTEGAVRVAAVDGKRFDVTHFLSRERILASRSQVQSIFPAALVEKIA